MPLVLVLGGTRSGKSEVAEAIARAGGGAVTYVATGTGDDPEMRERIAVHRARRPPEWRTEEASDPPAVVASADGATVLVDSLGGWIAGLMGELGLLTDAPVAGLGAAGERARTDILARVERLALLAAQRPALTVVVAEESGLGPVPQGAVTRRYLDVAGASAQALAARAQRVLLVVAGRTLELGGAPPAAAVPHPVPHPSGAYLPPGEAVPAPGASVLGSWREPLGAEAAGPPELRLHGDAMVPPGAEDFAVNVVGGARPPWLEAALAEALAAGAAYPDEREAVVTLARRHGRAEHEVVPLNGAAEGFWLLAAATRPRLAVCVHPSFTEPEAALRAYGHPVERAFRRPGDFALDPARVPDAADLVVCGNPGNPTGRLDPAATVAALARPGRVLVVDEAFMEFCPGELESLAARTDLPGLVVVRSLTKLWSLAGVRAGYLLAPRGLAAAVRRLRPPWNVNALALAALRACAKRVAAGLPVAERIGRAREVLRVELERLPGVATWPSAANFLLAHVERGELVHRRLLAAGIAVRPAWTFPGLGPDHLRLTVRTPEANARLVRAMRAALA